MLTKKSLNLQIIFSYIIINKYKFVRTFKFLYYLIKPQANKICNVYGVVKF